VSVNGRLTRYPLKTRKGGLQETVFNGPHSLQGLNHVRPRLIPRKGQHLSFRRGTLGLIPGGGGLSEGEHHSLNRNVIAGTSDGGNRG